MVRLLVDEGMAWSVGGCVAWYVGECFHACISAGFGILWEYHYCSSTVTVLKYLILSALHQQSSSSSTIIRTECSYVHNMYRAIMRSTNNGKK